MPIDASNFKSTELFKFIWETHNDNDLPDRGLNEITINGAKKIEEYMKLNNIQGEASPEGARAISADEKAVVKAFLEDDFYGQFVEQDGLPEMMKLAGLKASEVDLSAHAHRPVDEGDLALVTISQFSPVQLARIPIERLASTFLSEYRARSATFQDPKLSAKNRSVLALRLLRDYSAALWSRGEQPLTEKASKALLAAFNQCKDAQVMGARNFNGAPWGIAQSLVLGMDPNKFQRAFPDAKRSGNITHLAMNDNMAKPMRFADDYNEAAGKPRMAEKLELAPPVNYVLGLQAGHTKKGSLEERRAFSTTGLNWGIVLFPGDKEIADLPPAKGFDFPVDCLDGLNRLQTCDPKLGEKLVVQDKDGNAVKVEKVIDKDEDGKAIAWHAVFKNEAGEEIANNEVLGRIQTAYGNFKGDGKATGSMDMWWWGFCDRNTAQYVVKAMWQIESFDRATIRIPTKNGKHVDVPMADAQKLVDAHLADIPVRNTFCAFRNDERPAQIELDNGKRITGKLDTDLLAKGAARTPIEGDLVAIHDAPGKPMTGYVELEVTNVAGTSKRRIDVDRISYIAKDAKTGKITVTFKNNKTEEGSGIEGVSFDGIRKYAGKFTVRQTKRKGFPIRGFLDVTTGNGKEKLSLADVKFIAVERADDLRMSQYLPYVSKHEGVFASDGSSGVVVSNGMRWVNLIDEDIRTDKSRPSWATKNKDLVGVDGPLKRQKGDKMVWIRALHGNGGSSEPTSMATGGWVQVDENNQIINEGIFQGSHDFLWGFDKKAGLNWLKPSSFNKYLDPEMIVALMVNGFAGKSDEEMEAMATKLNFPANWKDYRIEQPAEVAPAVA